jgi:glutamate synthase domain-containing protein 3
LENADILAIFDEEAENDIRTLLHKHISRTRSQDAEIIEQLNSFYSQFNPAKAGQAEGIWKAIKKDYQANALAETNRALEKKYGCNLSTWKAQSEVAKPEPNAGHSFSPDKTYTTFTNERAERSGARPSQVWQPTLTSRGMPSAPSW